MKIAWNLSAVAVIGAGLLAASSPAEAFGTRHWDPSRAPEHPRLERFVNHFVYRPRYTHVYHTAPHGDPYAYRYARRAYYPSYGSQYWVPAAQMRNRYRYHWSGPHYVYQPSWGRPRADHVHVERHREPVKPTK